MKAPVLSVLSMALALASLGFPEQAQADQPPLSLVDTIAVGGTADAVVVDHSPLHNDVVFYDRGAQQLRFIDAETLTLSSDFVSLSTTQWEGWLLVNRVHHLVYFIGSRTSYTNSMEPWQEALVHVVENRQKIHQVSVNELWNPVSGSPQDSYYEIDGACIKQAYLEDLNPRIIIDNTYGGAIDVVDLDLAGVDVHQRHRGSYRTPLSSGPVYTGRGNSIALETNHETAGADDLLGHDLVYIADANGTAGQVTVLEVQQPQSPLAAALQDPILTSSHFLFTNVAQGLAVAGPSDRLWVVPGTQAAVNGALGEVNTDTASFLGTSSLPFGDQYHLLIDWYDPSRMFVCSFDGWYNDPDQALYLHLLVNGTVVESLKLLDDYEDNTLRGMAFDPYTGRLFLTIDTSVYVVQVSYGTLPAYTEIFSDDFERGSTVRWTASFP